MSVVPLYLSFAMRRGEKNTRSSLVGGGRVGGRL